MDNTMDSKSENVANRQSEEVVGTVETDTYKFTLAELRGVFFCHIDIKRWDRKVYKEMLADFAELRQTIPQDLYANINKTQKKARKLAALFGFVEEYETDTNIIMRNVWAKQY